MHKFGVSKIFAKVLTKKYSKNSNIVRYYYIYLKTTFYFNTF